MWFLVSTVLCLDNGLALTPPMGWMAWEQFHCVVDCAAHPTTCISEQLMTDMIDRLAEDGWVAAGYDRINIDDCWLSHDRDANGELQADPDRFPHGIPYLTKYAHDRGVKFGIYEDYGTYTCAGYPGSEGHLVQDAKTFAKWEVDMLKLDGCYINTQDMADGYPAMAYFLNRTGRPILYSIEGPFYDSSMDYTMLPPYFNMWRNWYDIGCNWGSIKSVIDHFGNHSEWAAFAGPGHWNDPDQLMIGMTSNDWVNGIYLTECRTQFAIWAILAAPLIMSNDLRNIPADHRAILLNSEIIAVDQDPLGKQGSRITAWGNDATVWVRELVNGEYAVALFNRGDSTRDIRVAFSAFTTIRTFKVRDLFTHTDMGTFTDSYQASTITEHDTVMLKLTPA
jgi:alpha-N-acetylgalactosaminidase